jgi:hypothetical protein
MEQYFDAFLYFSNWGTRELMLRLPTRLLEPETARLYCNRDSASARQKDDKVILAFSSEDEWGDDEWLEEGLLSTLIAIRTELSRGDLRALYLGWLLSAWLGERNDEEIEPPVPPGLGQLSASLESMAEFLRLDQDLLAVAAQASAPLEAVIRHDDVHAWISRLPAQAKDEVLTSLLVDGNQALVDELLHRFLKSHAGGASGPATPRRMVGMLLDAAEAQRAERQRHEAERHAQEQARREREAVRAREAYLDGLKGQEFELWGEIEALISIKRPKQYAEAISLLIDLRDLAARTPGRDFQRRLEALRQAHERKPAFLTRLEEAGL